MFGIFVFGWNEDVANVVTRKSVDRYRIGKPLQTRRGDRGCSGAKFRRVSADHQRHACTGWPPFGVLAFTAEERFDLIHPFFGSCDDNPSRHDPRFAWAD